MSNIIFCPNCGVQAAAGARYCGKCGHALPETPPPYMPPPPQPPLPDAPKSQRPRQLALAAAALAALALVMFVGWNVGRFIAGGGGQAPQDEGAIISADGRGEQDNSLQEVAVSADGGDGGVNGDEETLTPTTTSTATATATTMPSATATATDTPRPTDTRQPTPTDTPQPATVTPTLRPTVRLPTVAPPTIAPPTSTPRPASCARSPHSSLQSAYQAHAAQLGCAANNGASDVEMAVQRFAGGRMVWRGDNDQIYVLFNSGAWQRFPDSWSESLPTYSCGEQQTPPTPLRGFGKVWCENNSVRERLGDALEGEQPARGVTQEYEGGSIIRAGNDTYVLTSDGAWRTR